MIKALRNFIGVIIDALKWPVAILMLVALFPCILFIVKYISGHVQHPVSFRSFLIGFGLISFIQVAFKNYTSSFIKIIEHEFSHGLFALLTLNKVVGFDFSPQTGGGSIVLRGRLNWLVIIAPYFFPLLSVVFILFLYIYYKLLGHLPSFAFLGLGVTTAFHFWTTIFESHSHQTDLQRVGFPFAICFIPGANAIVYALMTVFVDRGLSGLSEFFTIFRSVL